MVTTRYLRSRGFSVVEMWECDFRKQIRSDTMLKAFIDSRLPKTPQRSVSKNEILAGVQSVGLFEMVEVYISVPDQWPDQFSHPTMSPHVFFFFSKDVEPASVAQLDAPSDWRPGDRGFNPRRGRQHSYVEIDHEIFSTVILSLPLIQEGQLSVSGEGMCTIQVNCVVW